MVKIAIVGDIHLAFSDDDLAYFNSSAYDLILFVGDLSNYWPRQTFRIATRISRLRKPSLLIPGNHDTVDLFQLISEVKGWRAAAWLFGLGQGAKHRTLQRRLGTAQLGGYSLHPYAFVGCRFDVIAARPFSMGGRELGCAAYLKRRYGVASMQESAALLKQCVDQSDADQLIFLAHNGPFGLGDKRHDIWGCDFAKDESDYGDSDLTEAIGYAAQSGKQVLAVIGGHMHHSLKGGGQRQRHLARDGIHYLNAARVPRIFQRDGETCRHHVALSIDDRTVAVEEVLVS